MDATGVYGKRWAVPEHHFERRVASSADVRSAIVFLEPPRTPTDPRPGV